MNTQQSQMQTSDNRIASLLSNAWFQIGSLLIIFYLAYADTFKELWHYWVAGYNWQFVVPIAFVYMLWDRRDLYSDLRRNPAIVSGTICLGAACALLLVGQVSSTHSLREVSLVASVFSLVLLLFGTAHVRRLFWPLLYLVLMTSLTSDLLEYLRYPLKLISATVAADMLQLTGYAVFRDGTFLQLPFITLEVADSCSGLNQLVSAIALGIPIAFTFVTLWWKRIFIVVLSCVLGLIMNWVRVYLISLWHYNSAKGAELHGPYGIYELPFIFLIGVFLTLIVAVAIADKVADGGQQGSGSTVLDADQQKRSAKSYLVAFTILVITALYLGSWKAEQIDLRNGFSGFPDTIAGLQGSPVSKLEKPFYSDVAHDELILRFAGAIPGMQATVYAGYFHSQDQEKELIDYRFNWLHEDAGVITLPSSGEQIKMSQVKTAAGARTVYFWYDVNGRILVEPVKVILASLADALLDRRTNGAVVIVQFEGVHQAPAAEIQDFLEQLMNTLHEYLQDTEDAQTN
jgi:EpsI family protein